MNTTGIQNYLSNVFRPFVVYDTTSSNFIPKLEMSNIDTYSGNTISVFRADVGDANANVYVGKESGNLPNNLKACRYVSAFGYGAGSNISNDSNSVYVGYYAGATNVGTSNTIAIGANAGSGGTGVSNIFIGTGTKSVIGSRNIFLGHGIDLSSVSNQVRIGLGTNTPIAADTVYNWVGLGGITTPYNLTYSKIDISGNTRVQGNLGLNIDPGTRTLDVNGNFRVQDSSLNVLDFSNGLTRSSGGFGSGRGTVTVPVGPGVSASIGPIIKGIIIASCIDVSDSGAYSSRVLLATTTSNIVTITGNSLGPLITSSATNLVIQGDGIIRTCDYSITYFPLP